MRSSNRDYVPILNLICKQLPWPVETNRHLLVVHEVHNILEMYSFQKNHFTETQAMYLLLRPIDLIHLRSMSDGIRKRHSFFRVSAPRTEKVILRIISLLISRYLIREMI